MPKRKIDTSTGDPMLTTREEKLVHEFLINGGNGTRAAASAGYSAARAGQSAYQVLCVSAVSTETCAGGPRPMDSLKGYQEITEKVYPNLPEYTLIYF